MELFAKRPFACFCLVFFACSFFGGYLPVSWTVVGLLLFLCVALIFFLTPPLRRRVLGVGIGFAVAFLALCHSFAFTELPRIRAREWEGERMILCTAVESVKNTDHSSSATVLVLNADGTPVYFKGSLVCNFPVDLGVGDQLYARAYVEEYTEESTRILPSRKDSGGILLRLSVSQPTDSVIARAEKNGISFSTLFEPGGARILSAHARKQLSRTLEDGLGARIGSLASGFLMGDTDGLSSSVLRDFRRTGSFHLLSVSGLHLTVLLGAVELLLRGLYVPKRLRVFSVSLCSLLLLFMAGFAFSACRAVLMLMAVYLAFMLCEESDGITVLFASGALIVLISPFSVNDLGFWMSFQATLGILSVFRYWDQHNKRKKGRKGSASRMRRIWNSILSGILLTGTCNLFLLPILWAVFGEFSWISPVCNLLLSAPSSLFLIGTPLYLLLGRIPLIGASLEVILKGIGAWILSVAAILSHLPRAVISLRYEFCGILIVGLAIAMIVMLSLRLKHKWMLALPPVIFAAAFLICLGAYRLFFSEPYAVYLQKGSDCEAVSWNEDGKIVICDISYGGIWGVGAVKSLLFESEATEVDVLVLSHVHEGHADMLSILSEELMIRELYLPEPTEGREGELIRSFTVAAEARRIQVSHYRSGETLRPWSSLALAIDRVSGGERDAFLLRMKKQDKEMAYLSSYLPSIRKAETVAAYLRPSHLLIVGSHGPNPAERVTVDLGTDPITKTVLYGNADLPSYVRFDGFDGDRLAPREGKMVRSYRIPMK